MVALISSFSAGKNKLAKDGRLDKKPQAQCPLVPKQLYPHLIRHPQEKHRHCRQLLNHHRFRLQNRHQQKSQCRCRHHSLLRLPELPLGPGSHSQSAPAWRARLPASVAYSVTPGTVGQQLIKLSTFARLESHSHEGAASARPSVRRLLSFEKAVEDRFAQLHCSATRTRNISSQEFKRTPKCRTCDLATSCQTSLRRRTRAL